MNKFNRKEFGRVVDQAAKEMKIAPHILEKDYWNSYILDFLFNHSQYKTSFIFKGGTSLSKCFDLINRFSEDIDIVIDWNVLGYKNADVFAKRSNTSQITFNDEINRKASEFLKDLLIPELHKHLSKFIDDPFKLEIDSNDMLTIIFKYPGIHSHGYVLPLVRIEAGPLSAHDPFEVKTTNAIVASFAKGSELDVEFMIKCISPERTFWEKATILHKEANRTNLNHPMRYSRHFYDLYMLSNSPIYKIAINRLDLLKGVIDFKSKFYASNSAKYDDIMKGELKLTVNSHAYKVFSDDYEHTREMLFGEIPTFETITKRLKIIQKEINAFILKNRAL